MESLPVLDGLAIDGGGDLETDYQGRLSSVTNIPRQPDYLLGLATGMPTAVTVNIYILVIYSGCEKGKVLFPRNDTSW